MFELGAVGSPIDVATFLLVTVVLRYEMRPANTLRSAAIVALARGDPVDDQLLEADLDVDERDVQKVTQRPLIACGGRNTTNQPETPSS